MKIQTIIDLPDWYISGIEVSEEQLDALNADAKWYTGISLQYGYPGIEDDREIVTWKWEWKLCDIPISAIFPEQFVYQNPGRLKSIRNAIQVPPIITELVSNNTVRLLDGSHRITIIKEQNCQNIKGFVGNPLI